MNIMFNAYMKKKCYGGRTTLSRVVDGLFFRLVLFMGFYLIMPKGSPRLWLAITALCIASIVMKLIADAKLASFTRQEVCRIKKRLLTDKLLLMSHEELRSKLEADARLLQKASPITVDDLLPIIQNGCQTVYSVSPYSMEAQEFICRCLPNIRLLSIEEKYDFQQISDEEVSDYISSYFKQSKEKRLHPIQLLKNGTGFKYAVLAVLLLALSFFVRYAIYYRIIASLCLCIMMLCRFSKTKQAQ